MCISTSFCITVFFCVLLLLFLKNTLDICEFFPVSEVNTVELQRFNSKPKQT